MYVKIVNDVDTGRLQQALTALTDWAREWQPGIVIDCCVLNLDIQLSAPHLFINNCELNFVLIIIIIIYGFLERHKSLGYRGASTWFRNSGQ